MATKTVAKKKAPQDLTLRNLRAMKTRVGKLERQVAELSSRVLGLEARETNRFVRDANRAGRP